MNAGVTDRKLTGAIKGKTQYTFVIPSGYFTYKAVKYCFKFPYKPHVYTIYVVKNIYVTSYTA